MEKLDLLNPVLWVKVMHKQWLKGGYTVFISFSNKLHHFHCGVWIKLFTSFCNFIQHNISKQTWYMIRQVLEAVFSDEDSNWGPRIRNSKGKFETKTGLTWTRMLVMYFRRYYAMRGAHINFEQNSPKVLLSSSICLLPYQPERWSYQLELWQPEGSALDVQTSSCVKDHT